MSASTAPDLSAPPASRQARILVVDDVEANVLVLSKMVKALGYAPLSAPDGAKAIQVARQEQPDLILMDAMMPELDGIEATRLLKGDALTRLIPIVVVTALSDARSRQRAVDAGADDFVGKPVDSLDLQIRIQALLAVKRTYDELDGARRRAADQDRLKTEFLSSVSHQLRTPLTAITSAARVLQKHGATSPESVEKFTPMIVEECGRLTRLLDQVLDMARLEAGEVPWRDEVFDAAEVVSVVADVYRLVADEQGLQLAVVVRPMGPGEGLVRGDRDRITQVFINLVSNALKFTPRGGAVRLAAARVGPEEAPRWGVQPQPGAGAVLLAVEDTGVGIAPQDQAIVFEKYRQIPDPRGTRPAGTGLGLSISKEIVERHGGRIGLRSEPGRGSRFTIVLPEAPPGARR